MKFQRSTNGRREIRAERNSENDRKIERCTEETEKPEAFRQTSIKLVDIYRSCPVTVIRCYSSAYEVIEWTMGHQALGKRIPRSR